jgi:hypothetical protein
MSLIYFAVSSLLAVTISIFVTYLIVPYFSGIPIHVSNIHDIYAAIFTGLVITSITFFILGVSKYIYPNNFL